MRQVLKSTVNAGTETGREGRGAAKSIVQYEKFREKRAWLVPVGSDGICRLQLFGSIQEDMFDRKIIGDGSSRELREEMEKDASMGGRPGGIGRDTCRWICYLFVPLPK